MKLVSLMSSGIDSPVATYLFSKKVDDIVLVHGDNRPFSDIREVNNFLKLRDFFLKKSFFSSLETYIVPHGASISEFKMNCNVRFTCIFCKRMLLRYAEKIAESENANAIIMGDSLGQVASQTLRNIKVIEQAVTIPIFRPLIGYDKEDIVNIAKNIGTYDLSIIQSDGCNAVPNKPSTKANLDDILREEKNIDIIELVKNALMQSKIIK